MSFELNASNKEGLERTAFSCNTFSPDWGKDRAAMLQMMLRAGGSEISFKIDDDIKVIEMAKPVFGIFRRIK